MISWFDNHCHLDLSVEEVLERARSASVVGCINVGTDLNASRNAVEEAKKHKNVWATVGVHPHEAHKGVDGIKDLLKETKVVAVGEAGLDFYYDHSPRGIQIDVFTSQIDLANERNLPLVIHTREAWEETFKVLDTEGFPQRTVFHCFTGGLSEAQECLQRGGFLSFSGIVTFKNAEGLREAASVCPLERALVETDSPYLAPVPLRGKKNEPANVRFIGEELSFLMNRSITEVSIATTENALKFYDITLD